jgi:hypothetical protein
MKNFVAWKKKEKRKKEVKERKIVPATQPHHGNVAREAGWTLQHAGGGQQQGTMVGFGPHVIVIGFAIALCWKGKLNQAQNNKMLH